MFRQGFTCPVLLDFTPIPPFAYRAITFYGQSFQTVLLDLIRCLTGLFPVRSPLLRESRLISFPTGYLDVSVPLRSPRTPMYSV